jgi:hypothetical protein
MFRVRDRLARRLATLDLDPVPVPAAPITDAGLDHLPPAAQRYLRFMGVPGRPRVWSFRTRFRGQIRLQPRQPWMRFDAWQYNTAQPVARVVEMRILFAGVAPMFGSDVYVAGTGQMHGELFGLVTVADGRGPAFDVSELVTYVNDAVLLAPSMLLSDATNWIHVDDHAFDVTFTDAGHTVRARVLVDDSGRLVDFRTEDRWYAGPTPPVRTPWRTPVDGWTREPDGRRLPTGAAATWQLPAGDLTYVRGRFDPGCTELDVEPETLAGRAS